MRRTPVGLSWPAAVVTGVGLVVGLLCVTVGGIPIDAAVYRAAGQAILAHPSSLYDLPSGQLPFTYPPFAALALLPLALLPVTLGIPLLSAVSMLALYRTIRLTVRQLPALVAWDTGWVAAVATVASLVLEPVWRTLTFGQVDLLVMWLVVEGTLGHSRARGWLVGLAAGVKLTPAVMAAYVLSRHKWKALARMGSAFLATVAVGLLTLGPAAVGYWSSALPDVSRVGSVGDVDNQSIEGALWRLLGPGGSYAAWLALVVLAALVSWQALAAYARDDDRIRGVVTCALFGLLASPISWTHHWVWVVPLLLVLVAEVRGGEGRRAGAVLAAAWLVATATSLVWLLTRVHGLTGPFVTVASDTYTILGIATLLWLHQVSRRPSGTRAAPSESVSRT